MELKEGGYYWWQEKPGSEPRLCLVDMGIARFFNGDIINHLYYSEGIFTPAEVKPFGKEGCGCGHEPCKSGA